MSFGFLFVDQPPPREGGRKGDWEGAGKGGRENFLERECVVYWYSIQ